MFGGQALRKPLSCFVSGRALILNLTDPELQKFANRFNLSISDYGDSSR